MSSFWLAVTDLGDAAVTVPLAALLLVQLTLVDHRAAFGWAAAVAACAAVVVALKLGLMACGGAWHAVAVSPSGHAALAVAVYGTLAMLVRRFLGGVAGGVAGGALVGLAVLVAASRVVVGAHGVAEVLIGAMVGAGAALAFLHRGVVPAWSRPAWRRLAVAAALLVLVMHGRHWTAEAYIRDLAVHLARSAPACSSQVAKAG
jgi:membrane-associated phospholipid phosphatase